MAPKRRNTKRKSPRRRLKLKFGRKAKLMRSLITNRFSTTRIKSDILTLPTGTSTVFGTPFMLNQLPNYTEYTALFDQYRIAAIKITFIPRSNSSEIGSTMLPILYYVSDATDATLPTSTAELYEYPRLKYKQLSKPYSLYFKPKFADAAYQGAFSGYAVNKGWLSTASPAVQHFGLKGVVDVQTPTSMSLIYKFYLQFKDPK